MQVIDSTSQLKEDEIYAEQYRLWDSFTDRGENQLERYGMTGDAKYLQGAVECFRKAASITSQGIGDAVYTFGSLSNALFARFQQFGARTDLDQAIIYYQDALDLTPPGHPDTSRSSSLNNLASTLLVRFQQFGDRSDLDQSIVYYHNALSLRPAGHPDRPSSLVLLANSLLSRFQQAGDHDDLNIAVVYYQSALDLAPVGHALRSSSLVNLAVALMARFQQARDHADLDQAIVYYQNALDLRPLGHPDRSVSLNNLANALLARFQQLGDQVDLDEATAYYQSALDLTTLGHPDRSMSLANLADALLIRCQQVGDHAELNQAIAYYQNALHLRPPGHPLRSSSLVKLTNALLSLLAHLPTGETTHAIFPAEGGDHCATIIGLLREAASASTGGPPDAFLRASLFWVDVATQWSDPSAIEAYRISLRWLETVLATGRSLESRHIRLSSVENQRTRTLALDGAAYVLDTDQIEVAVELLEQGRSVLLTQAGKYRTRVDELREIDPSLAEEFLSISRLMDKIVISSGNHGGESISAIEAGDVVAEYHKLLQKWMEIIDRIRSLKQFKSFLRSTPFSVLRTAAAHGPVILLNISKWRSDAIIIHSNESPLLVPLPQATPHTLARMAAGANAKSRDAQFKNILRDLWEYVVQPVVHTLQNTLTLEKGSRIWWCPTGPAAHLPIHAAGIYNEQDQILPNIYIYSYTSTLSALISAREVNPNATKDHPNLLVVGQGHTPGQIALPSINREVDHIKDVISSATIIEGSEGTREAVLDAMQSHTWTHIACHGHVNQKQPFRSHFSLQNGPVTLLDIAGQNLPKAELAFLAACHSAEGNIDRPDEVLHLAAGLQFAGVRSVIGTLWAMCDNDGPTIAQEFYKNLVGDKSASAGSSAHALHRAIATFRARYPSIPSSRWACFVHYGR